jgi:hypothetical protein
MLYLSALYLCIIVSLIITCLVLTFNPKNSKVLTPAMLYILANFRDIPAKKEKDIKPAALMSAAWLPPGNKKGGWSKPHRPAYIPLKLVKQ